MRGVLVVAALAVATPQQAITPEMIAEAARDVVVEQQVEPVEQPTRPVWRDGTHFSCLGALIGATFLDLHSTERAILAGAVEQNPLYEPLVVDRNFTDFRIVRLGVGVAVTGLLTWLYLRAKHPLERSIATGVCAVVTAASIVAGGNNLQVSRQLEETQ